MKLNKPADIAAQRFSGRFMALDILRGLTIFLMLLVNNFGLEDDTPKYLTHAGWQGGVHLADFVFPWFLFCVGVSIPYSFASHRRSGVADWKHDIRVLRRGIALALFGVLVNSVEGHNLDLSIGILQLIAMAYTCSAILYYMPARIRITIPFLLLAVYWALIKFIPIPGIGPGEFDAGLNIINHINSKYLASIGLEGLPLVLPTTALVLIGVAIGNMTIDNRLNEIKKMVALVIVGLFLLILAYVWKDSIPFNKPLWTSSYVLLSAGLASVLMALFSFVTSVLGWRKWAYVFVVFGSNAIVAYVAPILMKYLILHPLQVGTAGWVRTLSYTGFWWVILWLMYRKKILLRL